jgi:outer membrane protein OmpA-like peptidoglycan-associated protein
MQSLLKPKYLLILLAIIASLFALEYWIMTRKPKTADNKPPIEKPTTTGGVTLPTGDGLVPKTNTKGPEIDLATATSSQIVERIGQALHDDDMATFERLMGGKLDAQALLQIREFSQTHQLKGKAFRVREVGETALNQGSRWALEYDMENGATERLYLDLKRDGPKWSVDKITLPTETGATPIVDDSLGAAEAFLLAIQNQKFDEAMQYVDSKSISDARIAGLCIIFEEGEYKLRETKPLRSMFQRQDVAGYMANVVAVKGGQEAQFSLTVVKNPKTAKWVVSEINLDRLLVDYADRVAGGDVYYSPLVKNPAGGDTLALYFGFDEDEISPRTRRQLEIVRNILKSDSHKKLTLSGHTDAKGTEEYNHSLSERRADVVRDFLIQAGVDAAQIVTVAKGSTQPRRPNVTESGADDPQGRRVNRRTEIYLDF